MHQWYPLGRRGRTTRCRIVNPSSSDPENDSSSVNRNNNPNNSIINDNYIDPNNINIDITMNNISNDNYITPRNNITMNNIDNNNDPTLLLLKMVATIMLQVAPMLQPPAGTCTQVQYPAPRSGDPSCSENGVNTLKLWIFGWKCVELVTGPATNASVCAENLENGPYF